MTNEQWLTFFRVSARVLGQGQRREWGSPSWCFWTVFGDGEDKMHYWSAGLPGEGELGPIGTNDGGTWGQPFDFSHLAHIVLPRTFYWFQEEDGKTVRKERNQNIDLVSRALVEANIAHTKTRRLLEIKLYQDLPPAIAGPAIRARIDAALDAEERNDALTGLAKALRKDGVGQADLYVLFASLMATTGGADPLYDELTDLLDIVCSGHWAKGRGLFATQLSQDEIAQARKARF